MRETRLYGSEGGEAKAFPTPIIQPLLSDLFGHAGRFEFIILKCNQRYNVIIISSLLRQDCSAGFHHIGDS